MDGFNSIGSSLDLKCTNTENTQGIPGIVQTSEQ